MAGVCIYCAGEIPAGALFCPWCGKSAEEKEKPAHAPKKRGNGQGTVYKTETGYVACRTIGYYTDENGKKHRKTVRKTFDKKKDAVAALPTLTETASKPRVEKDKKVTFAVLYQKWLPTLTVGKGTVNCYKAAWNYFSPVHDLFCAEIDIDDLQECIDDCPHGKRTKQNMKACASQIYKYGIPRGYFPEKLNLAEYLKVTGEDGEGGTGLPDIYVEKIGKAVDSVPGADLVYAQCFLGFRPSEFLALTHDSYDAAERTFRGGAKTEAGKNRVVTVSPKIQKIVDKYGGMQSAQFFCSPDGKTMDIKDYRELFYSVLEKLDLDNPTFKSGENVKHTYTPHSCRHTFSTMMKRAKGSDKDKQSLIGHSSAEMLRYYQDTSVEDLRKITDQF